VYKYANAETAGGAAARHTFWRRGVGSHLFACSYADLVFSLGAYRTSPSLDVDVWQVTAAATRTSLLCDFCALASPLLLLTQNACDKIFCGPSSVMWRSAARNAIERRSRLVSKQRNGISAIQPARVRHGHAVCGRYTGGFRSAAVRRSAAEKSVP